MRMTDVRMKNLKLILEKMCWVKPGSNLLVIADDYARAMSLAHDFADLAGPPGAHPARIAASDRPAVRRVIPRARADRPPEQGPRARRCLAVTGSPALVPVRTGRGASRLSLR